MKSREIRALLNAGAELDCPRRTVITSDYEKTETHSWFLNRTGIRIKANVYLWIHFLTSFDDIVF